MIDLRKAQLRILEAAPVLRRESVPILGALNRVLAEDIIAVADLPAADTSALDGYAVAHASLDGVSKLHPVRLQIIGEAPAGKPCDVSVDRGEAVRIMTGGLIPDGADTVVKNEITNESCKTVVCHEDPGRGAGIRPQGDSLKKGEVVLRAGDVIGPLEAGALASLRRAYVNVHRKPLVAIIATGDELSDFHEPAVADKTMCSNLYALAAQVMEVNARPLILGVVPDDLNALKSAISDSRRADIIITSGGSSKGKYDHTNKAFSALGLKPHFSNMFVKPGKPTIFATIGTSMVFGLPGNPSSTMISFEQFIRPVLLKMMGRADVFDAPHARAFARIDSFNDAQGGNKFHVRPSQVPLGKNCNGSDTSHFRQLPDPRPHPYRREAANRKNDQTSAQYEQRRYTGSHATKRIR